MPPKKVDKKTEKGQQKALDKQKQKQAEDKTFGLKNKNKSKAVQKYIKGVQQQATGGPKKGGDSAELAAKTQQKEEKKKDAQQAALLAALFKGTENVKSIKIPEGKQTDPKSIKEEQKISLYVDQRDKKTKETMEDWDQEKLEQVIKTKHGGQAVTETEIICKYFLDAVEKKQYGWFWICPNGGDKCKYRHCLPPGYVLKSTLPVEEDDEEEIPLEEIIENERRSLPAGGTPVTLESLLAWKRRKEEDRLAAVMAAQQLAEQRKAKGANILSGRDLFTFDPSLFVDDEGAVSENEYEENEDEDEDESDGSQESNEENPLDRVSIPDGDEKPTDSAVDYATSVPHVGRPDLFLQEDALPEDLDDLDD